MQLITPESKSRRTLRPGDVVVFDDGRACLLTRGALDSNDTLRTAWFSEGLVSVENPVGLIESCWSDKEYTIYSAEEWALKLVPKESSHE
jgi:hypothetical protein